MSTWHKGADHAGNGNHGGRKKRVEIPNLESAIDQIVELMHAENISQMDAAKRLYGITKNMQVGDVIKQHPRIIRAMKDRAERLGIKGGWYGKKKDSTLA